MHVQRTIDPAKRRVNTVITGEITLEAIKSDLARLTQKPGCDPAMSGLVDMRRATSRMTSDDVLALALLIKSRHRTVHGAKRALMVSDEVMFGLYRMFESFLQGTPVEYRIFRDEQAAVAWLDEPPSSEPA